MDTVDVREGPESACDSGILLPSAEYSICIGIVKLNREGATDVNEEGGIGVLNGSSGEVLLAHNILANSAIPL